MPSIIGINNIPHSIGYTHYDGSIADTEVVVGINNQGEKEKKRFSNLDVRLD